MCRIFSRFSWKSFFFGLSYLIPSVFAAIIVAYFVKKWLIMNDASVGFNMATVSSILGGLILASAFFSKDNPNLNTRLRRIGIFYIISTIAFVVFGISAPLLNDFGFVPYLSSITMAAGAVFFSMATLLFIIELPRLWSL